jgi:hypothetical protein
MTKRRLDTAVGNGGGSANDEGDGENSNNANENNNEPPRQQQEAKRKKKGTKDYKSSFPSSASSSLSSSPQKKSSSEEDARRNALPFIVTVNVPDPYTHPKQIVKEAIKNTKTNTPVNNNNKSIARIRRSTRIDRFSTGGGGMQSSISATVSALRADGSLHKVLGEFTFDANTNCGDLLLIANTEYEVISAKSQFRYAGNRKFVLVRKVLVVKEISRIAEEASLKRLMERLPESESGKNFE